MAKIKLNPEPTFVAAALIPIPGGEPAPVKFTFKHRNRDEITAWFDGAIDKVDAEVVQEIATGWELDDEFNAENIKRLCNNYAGAGKAILSCYMDELAGARRKN